MGPEWDIGARDVAAVKRLAAVIYRLPTLRSPGDLAQADSIIRARSFLARVYAVSDHGSGCELRIHFHLAEAGVRPEWSAWVRCDRPDRQDRTPPGLGKRFQRAFVPAKIATWEATEGRSAPRWVKCAHWWVGPDQKYLRKDITAQIWLFLLQARIVGEAAEGHAVPWLWEYLESRFELTGEESHRVLEMLLKQFWRAPSGDAWPVYVGRCKHYLPERAERRRTGQIRRAVVKSGSDDFTVVEAANAVGISKSAMYDMVQRGSVARMPPPPGRKFPKPPILISKQEVERLKRHRRPKPKLLIERRQRATDCTYGAARKWVWRQFRSGRTIEEIAAQLAN